MWSVFNIVGVIQNWIQNSATYYLQDLLKVNSYREDGLFRKNNEHEVPCILTGTEWEDTNFCILFLWSRSNISDIVEETS